MSLNVVFRTDGSPLIGSGHVMRCLTLARKLKAMGMECRFVCREFPEHLGERIVQAGFEVLLLPFDPDYPKNSWLGATAENDSAQTIDVLKGTPPDWLVIDHYEISVEWEIAFYDHYPDSRVLVIDDLANRLHRCDCLVDLSPGRSQEDYQNLVNPEAELCLGLEFALLRSEFTDLRMSLSGPRSRPSDEAKLLITFGGAETSSHLREVAAALRGIAEDIDLSATVIGASKEVRTLFPDDVRHLTFSHDLANEIAQSDLMICGAGGTNWERYCLGVPGVVIQIADNQTFNANAIKADGGGLLTKSNAEDVERAVRSLLSDAASYAKMSDTCWKQCDGRGADRVAQRVVDACVDLVVCTEEDARFVYDARYGNGAEKFYKNPVRPSFDDHVRWYASALPAEEFLMFCAVLGVEKIAHIRLDPDPELASHVEIGIALDPKARGKGLGKSVLKAACSYAKTLGFEIANAEVHHENTASMKLFEQCGFKVVDQKDDLLKRLELSLR